VIGKENCHIHFHKALNYNSSSAHRSYRNSRQPLGQEVQRRKKFITDLLCQIAKDLKRKVKTRSYRTLMTEESFPDTDKYFYVDSNKRYRYRRIQTRYTIPNNDSVEETIETNRSEANTVATNNKPTPEVKDSKPSPEQIDAKYRQYLERLEAIESKSLNLQDLIWGYYVSQNTAKPNTKYSNS
jgi:hypothetical protein